MWRGWRREVGDGRAVSKSSPVSLSLSRMLPFVGVYKRDGGRAYLELKNCIHSPHQRAGIVSPTGISSKKKCHDLNESSDIRQL